jgi:hypothetical protein
MVSPYLLIVPRTYGANISIGYQIKLKICGPFPRESAKKKAYADIRRKNPADKLVDPPACRRQNLCAFPALQPVRRGGRVKFFFSSAVAEDFFLFSQRRRDAKGDSLRLSVFARVNFF